MATLPVCGTALKIILLVAVILMVAKVFNFPLDSTTGLRALGVMDVPENDRNFIIRNAILESEDMSWTKVAQKTVTNVALVEKKILKFVRRIREVEMALVHASQESLTSHQLCQVKQMITHLKLIKTLFEKSVFLMKLADLASHRMDSSPWIAWDQLEPAIKELEENIKTLRLRDEEDRPIYVCFTRNSVVIVSFIMMAVSCLILALKVARCLGRR